MESETPTILVAVSDVFFYTKIRDAVRPRGYVLERVRTVEDATEKSTVLRPRALVLNMNDDRIDAFRALEQIKQNGSSAPLPVLAFANHEEVDTWRRAKELGVTKIVSRNEFSARTLDLLEEVVAAGGSAPAASPPETERIR
jgi:PleD family two-component response regulator